MRAFRATQALNQNIMTKNFKQLYEQQQHLKYCSAKCLIRESDTFFFVFFYRLTCLIPLNVSLCNLNDIRLDCDDPILQRSRF